MSSGKRKKVVVTTNDKKEKKVVKATQSRIAKAFSSATMQEPMTFGKQNYLWMLGGIALIFVGLMLMMGGHMPDNNTWDDNLIYGFRRTVLAPVLILAGLIVEVFAILKK